MNKTVNLLLGVAFGAVLLALAAQPAQAGPNDKTPPPSKDMKGQPPQAGPNDKGPAPHQDMKGQPKPDGPNQGKMSPPPQGKNDQGPKHVEQKRPDKKQPDKKPTGKKSSKKKNQAQKHHSEPDRNHYDYNRGPQSYHPGVNYNQAREWARADRLVGYKPLPPGIRKNLVRGKPLPPGIAKKQVPSRMLHRLPAQSGYEWYSVGSDLVLLAASTMIIVDILQGVFD